MTTKPLKLVVALKKIDYSGGNIGNDLTFGFEVNKEFTFLEQKISVGKSQPINRILYRLPVAGGEKIDFVASVVVTEQDLIFDDIGQSNTAFTFDVTPSGAKNHEFQDMYQELTVNAQSKDALNKGNDSLARTLWFNLVSKDHKWDHKPILAKKLGLENPPDYWFPVRGDSEHEWLSHLQDYLNIQQANSDVSVIIEWVDGNLR